MWETYSAVDTDEVRVSNRSPNTGLVEDVPLVRFSQKWKTTKSLTPVPPVAAASLVPLKVASLTPRRSTKPSVASEGSQWGDRIRSHSPTRDLVPVQAEVVGSTEPPVSDPVDKVDPDPVLEESVKSFSTCVKTRGLIVGQTNKVRVPALKQAAIEKKKQEQKELQRKNFRDKIREWRNQQNKIRSPVKVDSKPDAQHCGVKRPSELESSVSKKQKLQQTNDLMLEAKTSGDDNPQTPEVTGFQNQSTIDDHCSPQYELTPVGFLHTNYDKKLHRRHKHVPSWAAPKALENSMMLQGNKMENLFTSETNTLNSRLVFGTPDSMVVKNATARAYKYDHRSASSVDWSDKEEEDNDKN
eukprot:g229.t1